MIPLTCMQIPHFGVEEKHQQLVTIEIVAYIYIIMIWPMQVRESISEYPELQEGQWLTSRVSRIIII